MTAPSKFTVWRRSYPEARRLADELGDGSYVAHDAGKYAVVKRIKGEPFYYCVNGGFYSAQNCDLGRVE